MKTFKRFLTEAPKIYNSDRHYPNEDSEDLIIKGNIEDSPVIDFSDWVEYDEQYSPGCIVEGNVTVSKIDSFKTCVGAPSKIKKTLTIQYCKNFISLKGLPEKIGGNLYGLNIRGCTALTTLEYCPKQLGAYFNLDGCTSLISLKYMPKKMDGDLFLTDCKNLKNILHVFLTIGIDEIHYDANQSNLEQALYIICDHYFKKDRDLLECKAELIERGLSEYAKL
jgi:hypothetical protein